MPEQSTLAYGSAASRRVNWSPSTKAEQWTVMSSMSCGAPPSTSSPVMPKVAPERRLLDTAMELISVREEVAGPNSNEMSRPSIDAGKFPHPQYDAMQPR